MGAENLREIIATTLAEHRPLWSDGECECGSPLPVDGRAPMEAWQASVWRHQAEMIEARLGIEYAHDQSDYETFDVVTGETFRRDEVLSRPVTVSTFNELPKFFAQRETGQHPLYRVRALEDSP